MDGGSLAHKVYGGVQLIRACKDWPKWLREYATRPVDEQPECYRLRGGALLHTRRNGCDLHMIDEIWAFRKYDYFGYRVQPGDVVVDVGANIGTFTVYAAVACKAARVISFEPFSENFRMLRQNVDANRLGMVTCVNKAVAAKPGRAAFRLDPDDQGSHGLADGGPGEVIVVDCCTMEDVFRDYSINQIDYLKMDCEGAEYEILLGMPTPLLQRVRRISMEYHNHPQHDVDELRTHLHTLGFQTEEYGGHRLYARRLH